MDKSEFSTAVADESKSVQGKSCKRHGHVPTRLAQHECAKTIFTHLKAACCLLYEQSHHYALACHSMGMGLKQRRRGGGGRRGELTNPR